MIYHGVSNFLCGWAVPGQVNTLNDMVSGTFCVAGLYLYFFVWLNHRHVSWAVPGHVNTLNEYGGVRNFLCG